MNAIVYMAAIEPEEEGGYSVDFPDVPGAITQGETFEEAIANARDALETLLDALLEHGDALPPASEPQALARKIIKAGAVPAPIYAEPEAPAVPVNISMEKSLLQRIDRAAKAKGKTRSAFLADAARAALVERKPKRARG